LEINNSYKLTAFRAKNLNAVLFCYLSINTTFYFADVMISVFREKDYHNYVLRKNKIKEVVTLSVRERILALRLLEKQKKNPELAKQLGIDIKIVDVQKEKKN